MSKKEDDGWIQWVSGQPPPPKGTVLRLKFVNGVISNPITIQDGRGLAWGEHRYFSWNPKQFIMNGWRIAAYQILN